MKNNDNVSYTQSHITDALLKLMEKQNFEDISITEIVNEAGVGRASFYRSFTSKEDVLKKYILRLLKQWDEEFKETSDLDWVSSLLWHFYNNKNLYSMLFKSDLSYLIFESIKLVDDKRAQKDNIHAYFNAAVCGAILGWVEEWFSRGLQETPDEIIELLKQAIQMAKLKYKMPKCQNTQ